MIIVHPEIVLLGDPVLRQQAEPIRHITPKIQKTIDDMIRIMREAHGIGLAAPQIGLPLRLFVIHDGEREQVFINPRLVGKMGREVGEEGCLSLPGLYGEVSRARRVEVVARNRLGREVRLTATDLLARAIQHELDHLNGVLFIDHARPQSLHLVLEQPGEGEGERGKRPISLPLSQVEEFYRQVQQQRGGRLPEVWQQYQAGAAS